MNEIRYHSHTLGESRKVELPLGNNTVSVWLNDHEPPLAIVVTDDTVSVLFAAGETISELSFDVLVESFKRVRDAREAENGTSGVPYRTG